MFEALREKYLSVPYWYKNDQVLPIYLLYLIVIWWIANHDFSLLIVICPQCHIPFITSYRNKNRKDVHCPFGCRQLHQRNNGNFRSIKYYQTAKGRENKYLLNRQRRKDCSTKLPTTSTKPVPPIVVYLHLLLSSVWGENVNISYLCDIWRKIKNVRQRGIPQGNQVAVIDRYE